MTTLRGRAYFVTVVTHERENLFGKVTAGEMQLTICGEIVQITWEEIPFHFSHVILDAFVIIPNHVHGIICIQDDGRATYDQTVGTRHAVSLPNAHVEQFGKPVHGSIPTVIRSFKSAVTKRVNILRGTPSMSTWQSNYYEHIIRNDADWTRINAYIQDNPAQWENDHEFNPGG